MENETIEETIDENIPEMQTPPHAIEKNKSSGALIGTIIVLIVIILGGIYLWSTRIQPAVEQKFSPTEAEQTVQATADTNATVEQLAVQSPSDDTASIASDLNATNIDTADKDLQAL